MVPVVEVQTPPEALYSKCEEPAARGYLTVGDIMDSLLDYKLAFGKCASKIDNIRKWADQSKREEK